MSKGITVIELLIVIGVIMTVSSITISFFNFEREKAKLEVSKDIVIEAVRNMRSNTLSGKFYKNQTVWGGYGVMFQKGSSRITAFANCDKNISEIDDQGTDDLSDDVVIGIDLDESNIITSGDDSNCGDELIRKDEEGRDNDDGIILYAGDVVVENVQYEGEIIVEDIHICNSSAQTQHDCGDESYNTCKDDSCRIIIYFSAPYAVLYMFADERGNGSDIEGPLDIDTLKNDSRNKVILKHLRTDATIDIPLREILS